MLAMATGKSHLLLNNNDDDDDDDDDDDAAGLEGVRKIVDDILICAPTLSILKKCTCAFLDQCRHHGVTLKQTKSQLAVTEVDFGGFRLSPTGIQTSPDLLKSIRDFP